VVLVMRGQFGSLWGDFGNSMWEFQVEGGTIESSPGVADINNDGRMEIIFGVNFPYEDTASVYAIYSENNEPKILWEYQIQDIPDKKKATPTPRVETALNMKRDRNITS